MEKAAGLKPDSLSLLWGKIPISLLSYAGQLYFDRNPPVSGPDGQKRHFLPARRFAKKAC